MKGILALITIVIMASMVVVSTISYKNSEETVQITITDKQLAVRTDGDGNITNQYLVFTTDEVFENVDSFLFGKFNSSDIQNQLKIDSTYTVTVVGKRIPAFSMYRNIVKIH